MIPRLVWWFIGAGLILRLALWAVVHEDSNRIMTSDSEEFENIAVNLLDHGSYSKSNEDPSIPDMQRTPVFPLFMAGLYEITGRIRSAILLFNHGIFVLAALCIFWIAKICVSERVGKIAVCMWSVDPSSILSGNTIMAETVFSLWYALSLYVFLIYVKTGKLRNLVICGMLFGLSTLTKPASMYSPLVVAMVVALPLVSRGRRPGTIFVHVALFLMAYAAVLAPWCIRNHRTFGILSVTSMQEHQLLYFHAAMVESNKRNQTLRQAQDAIALELSDSLSGTMNERISPSVLSKRRSKALEILQQNWFTYVSLHIKGMVITLIDPNRHFLSKMFTGQVGEGMWQILGRDGVQGVVGKMLDQPPAIIIAAIGSLAWVLATISLAAMGIVGGWRHPMTSSTMFLALLWIAMCLVTIGPNPGARFRVMFFPEIAILAGIGLDSLARRLSNLQRGRHHA